MISTETRSVTFDALAFEIKHQETFERSQHIPVEIDSHYDFGRVFYRVWHGRKCLGTFYRSTLFSNLWESEAFYNNQQRDRNIHNTPDEAQAAIVSQSGLERYLGVTDKQNQQRDRLSNALNVTSLNFTAQSTRQGHFSLQGIAAAAKLLMA